jgi:hypothetical protein
MINTGPMSHDEMRQLLLNTANLLDGLHPVDVLTLAGFLAGNAIACWAHGDDRMGIARGFAANLLAQAEADGDAYWARDGNCAVRH